MQTKTLAMVFCQGFCLVLQTLVQKIFVFPNGINFFAMIILLQSSRCAIF